MPNTASESKYSLESPATVAARIRRALPFVDAKDVIACTDCSMKYLPRETAAGKMRSLVEGARIVRRELEGG
jgi:5-methyltetrahydropteroyltriglutamate--homocysteine methyltransferase